MKQSGIFVGKIESISNMVKRKDSLSLAWNDASLDTAFYENDLIFTHADSFAELELYDKSQLMVSSETLLKLQRTKSGGIDLEILKGDMTLKFAPTSKSSIVVRKGKEKLNLTDRKSIFIIKTVGDKLSVKKTPVIPTAPQMGARILLSPEEKITLSWIGGDKLKSYKVELAKDREFKEIVYTKETDQRSVKIMLPDFGRYFWKVSNGKDEGAVFYFNLIANRKLTTYFPKAKDTISISEKKRPVTFKWEKIEEVRYLFQLKKGDKIITEEIVKGNRRKLLLDEGAYHFRVKLWYSQKQNGPWCKSVPFRVLKDAPLELLSPLDRQVIDGTDEQSRKIDLVWKNNYQKEYEVEIWLDGKNEPVKRKIKTQKTRVPLKEMKIGRYFWRVRGSEQKNSKWSKTYSFKIKKNVPLTQISPVNNARITLSMEQHTVHFEIEGDSEKRYKLSIFKDKRFKDVVSRFELKELKYEWKADKVGKFYFKIEATDQSESIHGVFELYLDPFELKKPIENKLYRLKNHDENIVFGWAVKDLELLKIKEPKYVLEINNSSSFSRVKKRVITDYLEEEVTIFNAKRIYWRVRLKGASKYIKSSKVGSFKLKLPKFLPAPVFKKKKRIKVFKRKNK